MESKKRIALILLIVLLIVQFSFMKSIKAQTEETVGTGSEITYVGTFNVSMVSTKDLSTLKPGDEFTVNVNVSNLNGNRISALSGMLYFNTNVLEIKNTNGTNYEIQGTNGWDTSEDVFNPNSFKFVTENDEYITNASTVFTVKFIVKNSVSEDINTEIGIKDITASGGNGLLNAEPAKIDISVKVLEEKLETTQYTINETEREISRIEADTKIAKFINNVTTSGELVIIDAQGNEATSGLIKTGYKAKVGNTLEYTLIVTGDVDGDGLIWIEDLAKVKLHEIGYISLTGIYAKAGDTDHSGSITIQDVAQIKLASINLLNIK